MRILNLIFCSVLVSCQSTKEIDSQPKYSKISHVKGAAVAQSTPKPLGRSDKKYSAFKGEVEYRQLKVEGDWIGGSEENPVYYTRRGERIYSLGKDIYVYPVTVFSINSAGKVIYPEDGIQLVGDMQLEHFLLLVDALGDLKFQKNLRFAADSNFLEKPARVIDLKSQKVLKQFVYEKKQWLEVK